MFSLFLAAAASLALHHHAAEATPIKIEQDDICEFQADEFTEDFDRVVACLHSIPYDGCVMISSLPLC